MKTATISKKKFVSFLLYGMFERVVTDHEIDEETLATMKKLRQGKGSCGKDEEGSRRRRRRRMF